MDVRASAQGRGWQALRFATIVAADAACAALGAWGALLLVSGSLAAPTFRFAAPVVVLRVAIAIAARFHRWSFRASGALEAARLAGVMALGSALVAFAWRELPPSAWVLEYFLTSSAMLAVRYTPRVLDERCFARLPRAEAQFVIAERPRRVLNLLVALGGILLTLPLWVIIAAAIKLTSRGPVFYMQERIGLDLRSGDGRPGSPRRQRDLGGRPFMMYKFRTMRADAEKGTGAVWSSNGDPRVTSVGRFLRHTRLDELPQLLNVVKGDMNVVGPRPERATIFADLRSRIPEYAHRQRVRPGITGYAQVNLEYDSSVEDVAYKLRYDLDYLSRQSVSMDLFIMARTLPVMLFRDKMLSRRAGEVSAPGGSPQLG